MAYPTGLNLLMRFIDVGKSVASCLAEGRVLPRCSLRMGDSGSGGLEIKGA